nr:reverse transcriptase [Haemonchus contortus]
MLNSYSGDNICETSDNPGSSLLRHQEDGSPYFCHENSHCEEHKKKLNAVDNYICKGSVCCSTKLDLLQSREVNMMNDLAPELCGRKRTALGAFKSIEGVVEKTKKIRLRAHLFDVAVLPALTYASETWTVPKQDEHAVSITQGALEKTMLAISLYAQVQK